MPETERQLLAGTKMREVIDRLATTPPTAMNCMPLIAEMARAAEESALSAVISAFLAREYEKASALGRALTDSHLRALGNCGQWMNALAWDEAEERRAFGITMPGKDDDAELPDTKPHERTRNPKSPRHGDVAKPDLEVRAGGK